MGAATLIATSNHRNGNRISQMELSVPPAVSPPANSRAMVRLRQMVPRLL
jgi:hypothetical protein